MIQNFNLLFTSIIIALTSSCSTVVEKNIETKKTLEKIEQPLDSVPVEINYERFLPEQKKGVNIPSYDIDSIYDFDSLQVLIAYSDGDLETSEEPTNWGDRLMLMKGDSILFESKPVGDPYQYEPFFYRNSENNKVIIICQLGNDDNYGGEAFLFEDGSIEFMGEILLESPYETEYNTGLIEIIRISELDNTIFFNFEADTLVDVRTNDWLTIKNESIHYIFQDHSLTLQGLK